MRMGCGTLLLVALVVLLLIGIGLPVGDLVGLPGEGQAPLVAVCCIIPLAVASTLWVMGDAPRHGQPALLWGLITLLVVWPVGLLIYLVFGRS